MLVYNDYDKYNKKVIVIYVIYRNMISTTYSVFCSILNFENIIYRPNKRKRLHTHIHTHTHPNICIHIEYIIIIYNIYNLLVLLFIKINTHQQIMTHIICIIFYHSYT